MKRIVSLLLALTLLVSVLVMPASAATAKEVHTYLVNLAKEGSYDSDSQWWYNTVKLDEDYFSYGVFYLTQSGYIELSIFCENFEVTWRISSNPSPAYNAYILVYDEQNSKGTVSIGANYNGEAYSAFKSFSGDTGIKTEMLDVLNEILPPVVEFTRSVLNANGYTLRDLGLTAYNRCLAFHAFDKGKVTQAPTCGAAGVKTYTCVVCGYKYTEQIEATGKHTWDKGTVTVAPTCTAPGTVRYTCTTCKATKTGSVAALGHAWTLDRILTETTETEHGTASYKCRRCGETKNGRLCADEVFTDMPKEGNWAHKPIDWAYFNGITGGESETSFGPGSSCTRAQVVTFLWAASGRPAPSGTDCAFTDVKPSAYYYKAMLWAVENGITGGTSSTTFGPKKSCTRAETVTFLWGAAGRPTPETDECAFTDVKPGAYYRKAVIWAVENHITSGTSSTTYGPKQRCTRAQVVAFLYKAAHME